MKVRKYPKHLDRPDPSIAIARALARGRGEDTSPSGRHRMAGQFLGGVFLPDPSEPDGLEVGNRQLGTRNPRLEGMVRDEIVMARVRAEAGLVMGGAS